MDEYILKLDHISKHYPGVVALNDVSLDLRKGEIHALAGESGAGKSTLIKACSGAVIPDTGTITIDGQAFHSMTPQRSRDNGIAIIYQKSRRLFEQLNIDIDPEAMVKELTVGYQQMVEIAKAISQKAKVLIMDEPSAPFTNSEVGSMLQVVRMLRETGVSIIYISHRLDEIFRLSDRITILRDGQKIQTLSTAETNVQELITLMVGRKLKETFPAGGCSTRERRSGQNPLRRRLKSELPLCRRTESNLALSWIRTLKEISACRF